MCLWCVHACVRQRERASVVKFLHSQLPKKCLTVIEVAAFEWFSFPCMMSLYQEVAIKHTHSKNDEEKKLYLMECTTTIGSQRSTTVVANGHNPVSS